MGLKTKLLIIGGVVVVIGMFAGATGIIVNALNSFKTSKEFIEIKSPTTIDIPNKQVSYLKTKINLSFIHKIAKSYYYWTSEAEPAFHQTKDTATYGENNYYFIATSYYDGVNYFYDVNTKEQVGTYKIQYIEIK